jgi:hypothetical protein
MQVRQRAEHAVLQKIGGVQVNHFFDVELAGRYGLHEAILIANFQFWISRNKANGEHLHDGRTWTYNSVRAYTALVPYMTHDQVRRTLDRLVDKGVLVASEFNTRGGDRTLSYAFADEARFISIPDHLAKLPNGAKAVGKIAKPVGNFANSLITTDVNTDKPTAEPSAAQNEQGSRMEKDWVLPKPWGEWAQAEFPDANVDQVRRAAVMFQDHWLSSSGSKARKADFEPAWRNWCRNNLPKAIAEAKAGIEPWYTNDATILTEGHRLSLTPRTGETMLQFKVRIQSHINLGGEPEALLLVGPPPERVIPPVVDRPAIPPAEVIEARRAALKQALRGGLVVH